MRKGEIGAFIDFMADEAVKYSRTLTKPEIETWFENFGRTTMEDFKNAWVEHKRDPKHGHYFPKITDLQRILRTTGEDTRARDWRCAATVGDQRCQYPGGIVLQGSRDGYCAPHFRIWNTELHNDANSLQIIEASTEYVPPKTAMELMERGSATRAILGERDRPQFKWLHDLMAQRRTGRPRDPQALPYTEVAPKKPQEQAPAPDFDDVNTQAALAAADGE